MTRAAPGHYHRSIVSANPPPPAARAAASPVDAALDAFAAQRPGLPLAVAYSGGADSTALLLGCAQRWPGQVQAWHVHHGLQPAADAFEQHCRAVCQRLRVPLRLARIDARAARGQSPEDAARRRRYECFDRWADADPPWSAIQTVALAQHADDQVETVLLALSRGAGLPGLAAMPARWQRGGTTYWRPLLGVPGAALRDWLRARGATWIEDPSNADLRLTRNRLRTQVLPVLEAAFPHLRRTFARSAAHAAQAQQLLAELAADDLQRCGLPPSLHAVRALGAARQANLLRHWLASVHGQIPSSAQLAELQAQLAACATRGHRIHLRVGRGHVRRQGEALVWTPAPNHPSAGR